MREAADFVRFSEAELAERHRKVYALMEAEGVDALLVFGSGRFSSDVFWLTDWPGSREAYVLFQKGREPVARLRTSCRTPAMANGRCRMHGDLPWPIRSSQSAGAAMWY